MGTREGWEAGTGVLTLPSGRTVRGRSLRRAAPIAPTYGVYLGGRRAPLVDWPSDWIRWPDFWLPIDRGLAGRVLTHAWGRLTTDRVEIACWGGRGRTGTALACLAVLDGMDGNEAVDYVRRTYDSRAIETPWQKRYVTEFRAVPGPGVATLPS